MTKHQKRRALREAITDTFLGTCINFPINLLLVASAYELELTPLQASLTFTAVFTILAIVRKMSVRVWFFKKYGDA